MSTGLSFTRAAVYLDGRLVARLLWSGRMLKVEDLRGKGLGRLLPAGYHEGRPDDGNGTYDLWTAKHPHVHVPSDTMVEPSVTREQGIALALGGQAPRHADVGCTNTGFLDNVDTTTTPPQEGKAR